MIFRSIVLFLILSCSAISAERIEGRVVGVHDGDTLTLLLSGNQTVKIRLAQIDAPESDQAFGQKSRQSLAEMVFNKSVSVEKETVDKYGRTVGTVFVDGMDVNKNQVARGMAWVYRKYAHDKTLVQIEDNARQARAGLWANPNPVPPWEYRHGVQNQPRQQYLQPRVLVERNDTVDRCLPARKLSSTLRAECLHWTRMGTGFLVRVFARNRLVGGNMPCNTLI